MRMTALLGGAAGLFLMTAPAFAQDSTAPQTPPAPAEAAPAQPQTLSLNPGATVKGTDGAALGTLEGARSTPAGQELTVRGADGQLRGVPVARGVEQDGAGVIVGLTASDFAAAPAIEGAAPAPSTEPMTPPAASEPTLPTEPTTEPVEPEDDAAPPPAQPD
jgi:hypothetical protein